MADQQVPVQRTVVTMREYIKAVMANWGAVDSGPCTKGACAVLYAQYMIETGGKACFNYNLGNVKYTPGCGTDFMCLSGVWEGVSPVTAGNLIAAGRAVADPSPDHAKAVGPGQVSVIFPPPQPESRFRAFPDLATAMREHLALLAHRFAPAWLWVISGDYAAFANTLHSRGYFTASAAAYAAGMRRPYEEAMASSAWDDARDAMTQDDVPTMPELPDTPASSPTIHVGSYPLGCDEDPPPDDVA